MYRDLIQWKYIRDLIRQKDKSQRAVFHRAGISRGTNSKIVCHEIPPSRKPTQPIGPKIAAHTLTIDRLMFEASRSNPFVKPSAMEIYKYLISLEDYSGSYSTVSRYVYQLSHNSKPSRTLGAGEQAYETLVSVGKHVATKILRAMSGGRSPSLSKSKLSRFVDVPVACAGNMSPIAARLSDEDKAREWVHSIIVGEISRMQIIQEIGACIDLQDLLEMVHSGNPIECNRALTVLLSKRGISGRGIHRLLGIARRSCSKYLRLYQEHGSHGLNWRAKSPNQKYNSEPLKEAVFALLHEPPSNYDINRTTWRMADFKVVLAKNGHPACPDVIRTITKNAGYRWRKARIVLTSKDPDYSEKLKNVQSILSGLKTDEAFFSIDEFGPFAVKMKGGRSLVGPGELRIVPQWQKSKGCLILTAALELSSNQVTHFYSKKKNTTEMIKLMDILVQKYADRKRIFLSWDAASWHISKKLNQHIERHNQTYLAGDRPQVQTAPLPSGAQFLNVIESVFSGMARAIIHTSDYGSVDEAKAAIDRYFVDRNANFVRNPRRAGKKIWGVEREPAEFSCANNCKDPRYR